MLVELSISHAVFFRICLVLNGNDDNNNDQE